MELTEKIGGVTLNYKWYPGTDQYSDGDVEEELLRIAKEDRSGAYLEILTQKMQERDDLYTKQKAWPMLYHFSEIRPNIVSWLPITKEQSVLEIGSGCGAVTGALSDLAGSVTCVELSRRRSQINAYRNRDRENIEILVGNYQDIEKELSTFDYITLIGVFEYSQGYIGGADPYVEMLQKAAHHLKPGGQIVLAIENRIGLKYWAGATEDHIGAYFEGLEGYPNSTGVRTFSRPGLCEVIRKAGDFYTQFYYPFPDYKFPMAIYSDDYLPKPADAVDYYPNFDRERLQSFSEGRVMDTLIRDGLLPQFANSFLVLLGKEKPSGEKIVFAKYSNDRADAFSIRTDILQDENQNRRVQKIPMHPAAKEHLENLARWQERLNALYRGHGFVTNDGKKLENGGIELEYVQGETLAGRLDDLLEAGQPARAVQELKAFIRKVQEPLESLPDTPFTVTEQFREVFWDGEVGNMDEEALQNMQGAKSLPVTNIDLICSNVILGDPTTVIDCEWCFDFPIPISFLVYRILDYYIQIRNSRAVLKSYDLLSWAGIPKEQERVYRIMEASFQKYINRGHLPLDKLSRLFGKKRLFLDALLATQHAYDNKRCVQVFHDRGDGFSQGDSYLIDMDEQGIYAGIPVPKDVQALRLDPGMDPGICRLEKLAFLCEDGREVPVKYTSNGRHLDKDSIYFFQEDPQIVISEIPKGAATLLFFLEMYPADPYVMEKLGHSLEKTREYASAGKKYRQRIREMENTKVWKAYRAYRGLLERK